MTTTTNNLIVIDGDTMEATVQYDNTIKADGMEFIIFESQEKAGAAAREYWEDMAKNDPEEFTCLVGKETLISWALGQSAGPGTSQVDSLEEWLDLWTDAPEEHFASYDGSEQEVQVITQELVDELGIEAGEDMVAYRCN